ncbi:ABC transporter permease [Anaeromassilibacillus senegalensis]|uniref:ABC transporter permease n=1 Tax=Anaeromassilibacillus senegalensis TaxID=1673717 RepID=UPI0006815663|nr:ABC transporter permease [Anaeromassilibacillus senegalensis]
MKIKDMIGMSLSNLFKRKVRTLLTVAGVIIGTCAIVVMVSFGIGIRESMNTMMEGMGDLTIIQINNYNQTNTDNPLDDKAVEQIAALPHVAAVTPVYNLDWNAVTINSGKYAYQGQIYGVNMKALNDFGYTVERGEMPGEDFDAHTILFGHSALYNFYNTKKTSNNMIFEQPDVTGNIPDPYVDPLEDKLELVINEQDSNSPGTTTASKKQKPIKLNCIGVMGDDWSRSPPPGYAVFMDISFAKELQEKYNKINKIKVDKTQQAQGYQNVSVKADSVETVAEVQEAIQAMGFSDTFSMESIRKPLEEQMRTIQMILGGLGAISLLVAALGITNTMIMSIYERTREIGVMKVLGCVIGNIRAMFLVEAGTIGFIGGVLGLAFSYAISFGINTFSAGGEGSAMGGMFGMGMGGTSISIIPPWLALGALVFATMIGLVSGFYPANRAVKISALTAIKQE